MRRRLILGMSAATTALAATVAMAGPANAASKLELMSQWSQTSASSEAAFHSARANSGDYAQYGFNWSTDKCSNSPDNPWGFPFERSCIRHDFGYRNYKAVGQFDANKSRIDSAFYADMKRVCAGYSGAAGTACDSTAWTYYQAVVIFGVSAAEAREKADEVEAAQPAG